MGKVDPKRLEQFMQLSQKDQAGCLNNISDRYIRELVIKKLFGEEGWSGGRTPGGLLITNAVERAINAFSESPLSNRKE
jgi:hypothetical protein